MLSRVDEKWLSLWGMHPTLLARIAVAAFVALLVLVAPLSASAQGVPGTDKNKCLAGKTKCVSKTVAGLLKCRRLCQTNPRKCGEAEASCEAKVWGKFDGGGEPAKGCFAKVEAKAKPGKPDSVCTTTGDAAAMQAEVDTVAAEILARLEGTPAPTCGDGVVNAVGEMCDGADLNGATCASIGLPSGTLTCDSCTFDVGGCGPGLGSIDWPLATIEPEASSTVTVDFSVTRAGNLSRFGLLHSLDAQSPPDAVIQPLRPGLIRAGRLHPGLPGRHATAPPIACPRRGLQPRPQ